MARGTKSMPGQLSLFEMDTRADSYVVQANTLIGGKQALKLNSAKLIRAAIMQIDASDKELRTYKISIKELSKLLGISAANLYRDIDDITDDIFKNPVYIRVEDTKKVAWVKIPWVTRCEYHSDMGIAIKLNDELKGLLLDLREKGRYTQYIIETILSMKSVYGIRIFELLLSRVMVKDFPKEGIHVVLSVQEIRECCGCEDKYSAFSNFKARVLETAVKDIDRGTNYNLSYTYIKQGHAVAAIDFFMKSKFW